MTRRKHLVQRTPSGQPRRQPQLPPPAEVSRLRDAALAGMRSPEWATSLGRLFLANQITATQYSAGKRWSELSAKYATACGGPPHPRSSNLDPDGGTSPDPDSPQGLREGRRTRQTIDSYLAALKVLNSMGDSPSAAVVDVCNKDLHPVGIFQMNALRGGLSALAAWWGSRQ